jgi:hypothetical protein
MLNRFGHPPPRKGLGRCYLPEEVAFLMDMGDAVLEVGVMTEQAAGDAADAGPKQQDSKQAKVAEPEQQQGQGANKPPSAGAQPVPAPPGMTLMAGGRGAEVLMACGVPHFMYRIFTTLTQRGFRVSRRGYLYTGHAAPREGDPLDAALAARMYDVWPMSGEGSSVKGGGTAPQMCLYCTTARVSPPSLVEIFRLDRLRSGAPLKLAMTDGDRVNFMGIDLHGAGTNEADTVAEAKPKATKVDVATKVAEAAETTAKVAETTARVAETTE